MAYTISYTDVSKEGTITIEDGTINEVTSLRLPGRNTTAYGAVIAESFLHLLENFASQAEPANPSEGQIWYNNDPSEENLYVYNGTNWVPASGITKSEETPSFAKTGDLWVDIDNQQLYLFTGGGWILVGPQFSEGLATGARADQIIGQDNNSYTVLRIEVNGTTVGIISGADNSFIPKATIAGFAQINPGFNVISRDTNADGLSDFKFFGTAEKAENLIVNNEVIAAGDFLRGDTTSTTTFPLNIQNNQGINYGINSELTIGVEGQAGIIQHNVGGSNIDMRVRTSNQTKTVIRVDSNLRVGVNTEAPEQALDVVGTIQASENLLVNGTTQSSTINNGALIVRGGAAVKQNLNVGGTTTLNDLLTTKVITPDDNAIRDIGTAVNSYRHVYATRFFGDITGTVTGTIDGRSTQSDKLTDRTTFIMEGDVSTLAPVEFDGAFQDPSFDNGVDANGDPLPAGEQPLQKKFRTEISNSFIAGKPEESDVANNDLILFNDVAGASPGLKSATKQNFLKSIPRTPAGVILPYGGSSAPQGWLICDGRELERDLWEELFSAIGFNFKPSSQVTPGFFAIPDLRGRMPLGADNMGGTSANTVQAASADVIGATDGAEEKLININQIPDHVHDLQDADNNQYYVYQDRQDPTTDTNVEQVQGPDAADTAQRLRNSGNIQGRNDSFVQDGFSVMPPTLTLNYIIYGGRE
jgi:microcystin-dependent protein